jgi:hypothetical protein
VHQSLDELLSEILTGEVAFREFSWSQKLIEGYGLRSKWDRWLLTRGHAEDAPACDRGTSVCWSNSTGASGARQVHRRSSQGLSRKTDEGSRGFSPQYSWQFVAKSLRRQTRGKTFLPVAHSLCLAPEHERLQ